MLTSVPLALGSGQHTLSLALLNLTAQDSGDYFSATVQEIPAAIGPGGDLLEPDDTQAQQVDACNTVGPGESFYANLSTTSDQDWFRLPSDCTIGNATIHLVLSGGAVMDVFDNNNGGAQLAANVTSFDHKDPTFAGDDLTIHVHASGPKRYKFTWSFT